MALHNGLNSTQPLKLSSVVTDDMLELISGRFVVACVSVASCSWLYWDMCLTIDQEVEFVWGIRWSFMKCLYYFIRCASFVIQGSNLVRILAIDIQAPAGFIQFSSPSTCLAWQTFSMVMASSLFLSVEYVLLLRVFALYSQHRTLKKVLPALLILKASVMLVQLVLHLSSLKYDTRCDGILSTATIYAYTSVTLIFHLVLFVLTLKKFITSVRVGWGSNTPIMVLIMRDGTWSFFLLFLTTCIVVLLTIFADRSIIPLFYNGVTCIFSFIGYRNMLNIFKFSRRPDIAPALDTSDSTQYYFSTNIFSQHIYSDFGSDYEIQTMSKKSSVHIA